ncbi:MAG TPA: hypothetical protein VHS99_12875, partial [Chloroflexota bacterium]|nr:hypothetical protein [Chloroflexota bacterium]
MQQHVVPHPLPLGRRLTETARNLSAELVRQTKRGYVRVRGAAGRPPQRAFLPPGRASDLEQRLRPVAARLRWRRILEQLPVAFLRFGGIILAGALLGRLLDAPWLVLLGLLAAAAAAATTVVLAARRQVGPFEAARSTDATLALRERLTTALELVDTSAAGILAHLQVQEATSVARRIMPQKAVPVFAPGSTARRLALRRSGFGAAALAVALLLALWPAERSVATPQGDQIALADTSRTSEPLTTQAQVADPRAAGGPEAVEGRTDRPDQVGEANQGLLGQSPDGANPAGAQGQQGQQGQQGAQQGQPGQQAQADAQSQQNANVAAREQALQDLASALRQSQTAQAASESLRSGNTERASQQLNQVADRVRGLSPGERQSLAQALQQAAQNIGEKDRPMADAAQRAGQAFDQYQNQEAQQAMRDLANRVRNAGQEVQAQRDLQQRSQQMQQGQGPQLPQGQSQPGGPDQRGQPQAAPQQGASWAPGREPPRQAGQSGESADGLSELEAQLQNGGLSQGATNQAGAQGQQGQGAGQGAGQGSGGPVQGEPHRLAVEARPVEVEADVRPGPSQWRPPSPNSPPAAPPASAPVPAGPASAAPVGAGPDVNNVPWELTDP